MIMLNKNILLSLSNHIEGQYVSILTTKSKSLESIQEMIVAQYGRHVVLELTISQVEFVTPYTQTSGPRLSTDTTYTSKQF